jgi:hypothetical protein
MKQRMIDGLNRQIDSLTKDVLLHVFWKNMVKSCLYD